MLKLLNMLPKWLIPDAIFPDPSQQRRARLLAFIGVILTVVGSLRAMMFIFLGNVPLVLGYLSMVLTGLGTLVLVRRGVSLVWATHGYSLLVWLMMIFVASERGGVSANELSVMAVIPMSVTYILGIRAGGVWCLVGLGTVVALALLEFFGLVDFADQMASSALLIDGLLGLLITTVAFTLAAVFEETRIAAHEAAMQAERERAAARADVAIVRADKMATVGLLAAGVGHEVNNPLTYVQANINFVMSELKPNASVPDEVLDALSDALMGARRIAKIARDLATYARVEQPALNQVLNLKRAAESGLDLTQHEVAHRASIRRELKTVPTVSGPETRVVQVIVNLLLNAAHAVENQPAGEVVIRTGHDDGCSWLEVSDNGPGIPASLQEKVFEPFFTTKEPGKGTGLGLSVSRAIISTFGGDLRLTSEPGEGASFRLSLPASNVESTAHTPPTSNEPQSEQYRILVIDDELRLKRALSRMLRPHQVIWCESGEGMLSVLGQDQCFDLVLTDVMMYPMPGWKVLALLHTHYPALTDRFAFMTGGVFTEEAERHIHQSNVPVLAKPLTRSDIMSLIHKLKTASHPS